MRGLARALVAGTAGLAAGLAVGVLAPAPTQAALTHALPAHALPTHASPGPPRAKHVVVVGVAGLRWQDVSAQSTPAIVRLIRVGAAGSLSVRSAPRTTCAGDGWLTLGSGTYAAVADPGDIDNGDGCKPRRPPPVTQSGAGARVRDLPRLVELNSELRFGAAPGLLGSAPLSCVTAVGEGAALAVADPSGRVSRYTRELPDDPAPLLGACPLTVIDLGALPEGSARSRALHDLDQTVARIESARADGTTLMVLGVAETQSSERHLHPVVVEGPGFREGWLWSDSTRRAPYVQLADIAPTVLAELLAPKPPGRIAGVALDSGEDGRPASTGGAIAALVDTDTAADAQVDVLPWFFTAYGVLSLAGYGALIRLLWRRRRPEKGPPPSGVAVQRLGVAAIALASVPTATFLANLVPWWRASVPLLALTGAVLAAVALTVAVAYAGPWRRTPSGPAAAVVAVAVTVAALDALTGTTLQINSMLGYSPLVAGRFFGFGNIAAAAFGAAVMMLAAFLADGKPRIRAGLIVVAIAVPTVALDGAPRWGADFGGVLTFVPAFAILGLLVTRSRINALRSVLAAAAGVVVVAVIGAVDYLGGAHSHFGRFVGSVLDGSAGDTVYRKLRTSLDLLFLGAHTEAAFVLVVLLGILVFRPTATLRTTYERVPALRVALIAVVVMSVIGGLTNDSSVAIPLVAALVAGPLALALCARASQAPESPIVPDTPVPGRSEAAQVLP